MVGPGALASAVTLYPYVEDADNFILILIQEKRKHNIRHIKRATKKTNVIPSANNIVVVGANDIKSFQRHEHL